ncbi:MAG: MFS transporter [Candidatus Woesearchaeota archaeon]|jgi:MFS family permease
MNVTFRRKLNSNIWKYFIYNFTQRRSFLPLLGIYFLTLPDATLRQIGLYTSLGYLASFFLEIPTGYFSDRFGQRNTLILAKFLMVCSTFMFVIGHSFPYFLMGSLFMSMAWAFESGTKQVFMHNTLIALKKEKAYVKIMGKMNANISFFSALLIILLPFFTQINMLLPFLIFLVIDFVGLFFAISLVEPKANLHSEKINFKTLKKFIAKSKKSSFYITSLFFGLIGGFLVAGTTFKEVYLQSLGMPIMMAGFAMGFSRIVWFVIGNYAHIISDYISFKKLMFLEMFLFPLFFILFILTSNIYILIGLFALTYGYYWARRPIEDYYFLHTYKFDKSYKATMFSIKEQISSIINFVSAFIIGFVMNISYHLGYAILGISLFVFLWFTYSTLLIYDKKQIKEKN